MYNMKLSVTWDLDRVLLQVSELIAPTYTTGEYIGEHIPCICYLISGNTLQSHKITNGTSNCSFYVENGEQYSCIFEKQLDDPDLDVSISNQEITIHMHNPEFVGNPRVYYTNIAADVNHLALMNIVDLSGGIVSNVEYHGVCFHPDTKFIQNYDPSPLLGGTLIKNGYLSFNDLPGNTFVKIGFYAYYTITTNSNSVVYKTKHSELFKTTTTQTPHYVTNLVAAYYPTSAYPLTNTLGNTTSGINISFGPPNNVTIEDPDITVTYKIYRSNNSSYDLLDTISGTTYNDDIANLTLGTTYTYKVQCIVTTVERTFTGLDTISALIKALTSPQQLGTPIVTNTTMLGAPTSNATTLVDGIYYTKSTGSEPTKTVVTFTQPSLTITGGYTFNKLVYNANLEEEIVILSGLTDTFNTSNITKSYFYSNTITDTDVSPYSPKLNLVFKEYGGLDTLTISNVTIPTIQYEENAKSSATVTWNSLTTSGINGTITYVVHADDGVAPIVSDSISGTTHTFTTLLPETQYSFYVVAYETLGSIVETKTSNSVSKYTNQASTQVTSFRINYETDGYDIPISGEICPVGTSYDPTVFSHIVIRGSDPAKRNANSVFTLHDTVLDESVTISTTPLFPDNGFNKTLASPVSIDTLHTFTVKSTVVNSDDVSIVSGVPSESVNVINYWLPEEVSNLTVTQLNTPLGINISGTAASGTYTELFLNDVYITTWVGGDINYDYFTGLTRGILYIIKSRTYRSLETTNVVGAQNKAYLGPVSSTSITLVNDPTFTLNLVSVPIMVLVDEINDISEKTLNVVDLSISDFNSNGYSTEHSSFSVFRSYSTTPESFGTQTLLSTYFPEVSRVELPLNVFGYHKFDVVYSFRDLLGNAKSVTKSITYLYMGNPTLVLKSITSKKTLNFDIKTNYSELVSYTVFIKPINPIYYDSSYSNLLYKQVSVVDSGPNTIENTTYQLTVPFQVDILRYIILLNNTVGAGSIVTF